MGRYVALSLVKPEAVHFRSEGTEREARVLGRIGSTPTSCLSTTTKIIRKAPSSTSIFQYLGGGTLAEYLQAAGQLSLDKILRLGRQLCRGLSHLHKGGLIHRDVSPDNVWLDEHHAAHLGDFDSAIPATGAGDLRPITTKSYAAPEEQEGRSLDARSDLFSLGGVLYGLRLAHTPSGESHAAPDQAARLAVVIRGSGGQPAFQVTE